MKVPLRDDDFRCHDPLLVRILPGREVEAAKFALELWQRNLCEGVLVQNKEVVNWEFLEQLGSLSRFEFVNVSRSFTKAKLESIKGAKQLRIVGAKFDIDFSIFSDLEVLFYQWGPGATGLSGLRRLKDASLYEIGLAINAFPLDVHDGLERLAIVGFRHPSLDFTKNLCSVSSFSMAYARNLGVIPHFECLKVLNLSCVGDEGFDYFSISPSVEDIEIMSGAPIVDWDFVLKADGLKRIVVQKTKCSPMSSKARNLLRAVEIVVLPPAANFASS